MLENLNKQLRIDEGVVAHAYQDSLGFWTIGIGRLIDKRRGGGLSQEEISYLLSNDIESKSRDLFKALPWLKAAPEPVRGALVNMAFQMGVAGVLGFTTTLGLIKDGKYKEASEQMLKSKWAVQTPERAKRMAKQVEIQQWVFDE
jgi:lysozyme